MSLYKLNGTQANTAYALEGSRLGVAYDADGNAILLLPDYSNPTYASLVNISIANTQGFDIFNGTLFQFRAGSGVSDLVTTANIDTGAIITANIPITSDHGDSAAFSAEYYDEADDFPLLYVSADTSPYIYVNRVTDSSATLIRTIYLPYDVAGYHACGSFDWANNIMYTIGTVEDNYIDDDGGNNPCIVCKWDLANMTDNGDGTVTPALISTYQRPFIYVMQGEQYHEGLIWICSGYGTVASNIYAMNPETGEFEYTLTMPITTEIEGITWQSTTDAIIGFQGGKYYAVTFE